MDRLSFRPVSLAGRTVVSIPAENTLGFVERVFACWADGRLFAIARDPGALDLSLIHI